MSSSNCTIDVSPSTPPRRESQESLTLTGGDLFFLLEEEEEYFTAEEYESSSDDEGSEYRFFEEVFGDAESVCSEDEEADDAEFERRQALTDRQYSFDDVTAAVKPKSSDPFGLNSENDSASPPPSPVARPRVTSIGYPPHRCNCPHCPSRTDGYIPPFTPGSVNANKESFPRQRLNLPIAPLILTPSAPKPRQIPASQPGPTRPFGNLDLNRHSRNRSHQTTAPRTSLGHNTARTPLTLPSIRTLDIWHDELPDTPSRTNSQVPLFSRMGLPFILNPPPLPTPNQLSPGAPANRLSEASEVEDGNESDTSADDLPWLARLTPVINVSFIPNCSADLVPYSLSLTRNTRTMHSSRSSDNRFEDL